MQNKLFDSRWKNAVSMVEKIKSFIHDNPNHKLYFENTGFINENQLEIRENEIVVVDNCCTYSIFSNDPHLDEGLYDRIEVTNSRFNRDFKVYVETDWSK